MPWPLQQNTLHTTTTHSSCYNKSYSSSIGGEVSPFSSAAAPRTTMMKEPSVYTGASSTSMGRGNTSGSASSYPFLFSSHEQQLQPRLPQGPHHHHHAAAEPFCGNPTEADSVCIRARCLPSLVTIPKQQRSQQHPVAVTGHDGEADTREDTMEEQRQYACRSACKTLSTVRRTRSGAHATNTTTNCVGATDDPQEASAVPTSAVVVALIDNRAGEVGLAACDVRTATILLSQYGDDASMSKTLMQLTVMHPIEVLLPNTVTQDGRLARAVLSSHVKQTSTITAVHRKLFNESSGSHRLLRLMANRSAEAITEISSTDRYLCTAAANALVLFLENASGVSFLPQTVRVEYRGVECFLEMDRQTAKSLMMVPMPSAKAPRGWDHNQKIALQNPQSLAEAIDYTCTRGGRRLLRLNTLQPLKDATTIAVRQDAVVFLAENRDCLVVLRSCLRQMSTDDVDAIAAFFASTSSSSSVTMGSAGVGASFSPATVVKRVETLIALRFLMKSVSTLGHELERYVRSQHPPQDEQQPPSSSALSDCGDDDFRPAQRRRVDKNENSGPPVVRPTNDPHQEPGGVAAAAGGGTSLHLLQSLKSTIVQCAPEEFVGHLDTFLDMDVVNGRALSGRDNGGDRDANKDCRVRARDVGYDEDRGGGGGGGDDDDEVDLDGQRQGRRTVEETNTRMTHHPSLTGTTATARKKLTGVARKVQQCFAIKAASSTVLDFARRRYSELVESVFHHAEELRTTHGIPSLKVVYDKHREFYLTYDAVHDFLADDRVFVRKGLQQTTGGSRMSSCQRGNVTASSSGSGNKRKKSSAAASLSHQRITCTTADLTVLCSNISDAVAEIAEAEDTIVESLTAFVRDRMARLHALADAVSLVDLLCSFASFALATGATRPLLVTEEDDDNEGLNSVADGGGVFFPRLQPVIGCGDGGGRRRGLVPSDVDISGKQLIVVLSGPNASGKSTLLRTIGHAAVLAHIGCFVPCRSGGTLCGSQARIRLLDRIIAHTPASSASTSSVEASGESTFFSEMRSLAFVAQTVTRGSLVLVDEVGRGTGAMEGSYIAQALVEWLADVRCIAVVATHYPRLASLAEDKRLSACVQNQHMTVAVGNTAATGKNSNSDDQPLEAARRGHHPAQTRALLTFGYTVRPGPCHVQQYGILLAKQLAVHPSLLAHVSHVTELLQDAFAVVGSCSSQRVSTATTTAEEHKEKEDTNPVIQSSSSFSSSCVLEAMMRSSDGNTTSTSINSSSRCQYPPPPPPPLTTPLPKGSISTLCFSPATVVVGLPPPLPHAQTPTDIGHGLHA